ncbi:MAG: ferritin family protein [Syntrophobacteraceae bacterium]|jgi:rubrerythrin|nr:ferritin family protein [Syntrophobacteraceae bacterium]
MIFNFNAAEVFRVAIKIEENGKRFYEDALRVIDDPSVKKLFQELASQEVEHKKHFEDLRARLPAQPQGSDVWFPENEMEAYLKMMADQHVFTSDASLESALAQLKGVKDALKMAIEFEKDSVIFFLSMQEATDNKKDQEMIGLLVKEEQGHLRRLALELARLGK